MDIKTLNADASIYKLRKGQEAAAIKAAEKDGADNVFFRMGQDTFVASGNGMKLKGIEPGALVVHQGGVGTVIAVDNEINSALEGVKRVGSKGAATGAAILTGTAAAVSLWGTGGIASLMAPLATGSALAVVPAAVGFAAIGAATFGTVAAAGGGLYGALKEGDTEAMKAFAE